MADVQPKVSIVTPVFNRADIVHKAIDSVIAQTYHNWELLLVDDGSTDNIEEVIAANYGSDPRISLSRREREPKSASTCRNIGAEKATGEYLIFLDSDDMLEPHCLEQRVNVVLGKPELDFAVFRFRYLNCHGHFVLNNFDNGKDPLVNFLSGKSYWNTTCPIWKKSTFTQLGGFNPEFPRYQDIEISIRALTWPGIAYGLFMNLPPDTIIIPSVKKQSILFAMDVHESLKLLVPQTAACLTAVNKAEYIKCMEGYLKEWLKYFAHTNFNESVHAMTNEVVLLFHQYGVITKKNAKAVSYKIEATAFILKAIRRIFINLISKK